MKQQTLKDNLVYHRKLKGYTQDELSEKTTVGVRTIQRIEKGEVNPHLQTVKLLAEGLDIEVEDLIVLDNPKEEKVSRNWMLWIHGAPFFGFIIPFANVLIPLFVWTSKSDDNSIYEEHSRKVFNFHCTLNLMIVVSLILFFVIPGYNYFLTSAIFLFGIVLSIKNIMSAISKHTCHYPLSISFLKSK
ncbi:DUF4870 domain-containing protein [Winogradskyella sp.]